MIPKLVTFMLYCKMFDLILHMHAVIYNPRIPVVHMMRRQWLIRRREEEPEHSNGHLYDTLTVGAVEDIV